MNLNHKMKDEVSLVDKTDRLGAVKSEKPCQQPSVCHAVDSPPSKVVPRTVHGRIIGPPGPNIAAIPGPPLLPTVAFSQLPLPQHLHMENSLDTARSIKTR